MCSLENEEELDFNNVIEYASDSSGYIEEVDDNDMGLNIHKGIARVVPLYQCKQCDFANTSFDVLYEHYQTHCTEINETNKDPSDEQEEILVCSICYGHYLTLEEVRSHMIDDHGYEPKPETDQMNGNREGRLQNYLGSNDGSEDEEDEWSKPVPFPELKIRLRTSFIYKCSKKGCFYKFDTKEKQKMHEGCHTSDNAEKCRDFKCMECNVEFKNWRACDSHMWKEHKIDMDLLKCPFCTYKAFTSVKIWRHLKVHGKWRSKVVKKRPQNKEKKDNRGARWYSQKTCEICGRLFANSKTLSKHVKTVHNKIKPFICNVCGRKSARKITWMVHMRQHTGERPLQCKYCSFRASDPSVIRKHEMRHNDMSQYKCKSCKYTSIQSAAYKAHVKAYHPEDYKKIACDQCSYVSASSDMLERHKLDHKKGLIKNEDSCEANGANVSKNNVKSQRPEKTVGNVEISSDCFLPLESTDSIAHDPSIDTGGVTIPAHSEDTQFPNFINS